MSRWLFGRPPSVIRYGLVVGTGMLSFVVIGSMLVMSLTPAGCASSGTTKHQAVVADTAVYESLKAISDAEIVLFEAGLLTKEEDLELNIRLLPIVKLGKEANDVIGRWPGKGTPPPEVARLAVEIGDFGKAVIDLLPDGQAKAVLLSKINLAQQAILLLLAVGGIA